MNRAKKKLRTLNASVRACTACELHESRTYTVFGRGRSNADLVILGEAPSTQDDVQGKPFVGRVGQELEHLMRLADVDRENVYLMNVVKCRPPSNRTPTADEVLNCRHFLVKQIAAISPVVIVTTGRVASQQLNENFGSLGALRGQRFAYRGIDVYPTYHPAYVLRAPDKRELVVKDLKQAWRRVERSYE